MDFKVFNEEYKKRGFSGDEEKYLSG